MCVEKSKVVIQKNRTGEKVCYEKCVEFVVQ